MIFLSAIKNLKFSGGFRRRLSIKLCKFINSFTSKIGINVIASDFYSPIPNLKEINKERFSVKPKGYNFDALKLDLNSQEIFLKDLIYNVSFIPYKNQGLSLFDSFLLYAFIQKNKPRKIIEIGCGETTKIIQKSLKDNHINSKHICIEPYKSKLFNEIVNEFRDSISVIEKKVQDVSTEIFYDCDFLFIDSSHVVKTDSDVLHEFLEIIPKLGKGTVIHFHDIMIPYAYFLDWHEGDKYWNESYFLHAFLMFNDTWKTIFSSRYFQQNKYSTLKDLAPYLLPNHRNMSYYIQKVN
tara:strand:+ start:409 stop:1296 length:888 start_codon:yes stop_codon:yes gene_type:complete